MRAEPDFAAPATSAALSNLIVSTRHLGMGALEETWRQMTGQALPGGVRHYAEDRMREGDDQ
jgi:hypothetical protein